MICYQDRSFCPFYKTCLYGRDCDRALTPKVIADADAFGLPVDRMGGIPVCWEEDIEAFMESMI